MSARPGQEVRGDPAVAALVERALAVPSVVRARVRRRGGSAVLRLQLAPGADPPEVAAAVGARLGMDGGSADGGSADGAAAPRRDDRQHEDGRAEEAAVDEGRPPSSTGGRGREEPGATSGPAPGNLGPPAPRPGRTPVPAVSAPSVASTPAPRWLGEDAAAPPGDGPDPSSPPAPPEPSRLELRRVQVATEGLTAVAEVVMAHGEVLHTGVADAAATPGGTRRALAEAAGRCLESAAAGRVRVEVDAVQVEVLAGGATALVALSLVTAHGHQQLRGAVLEDGDAHRAVVHAVLAAANRRLVPATRDDAAGS